MIKEFVAAWDENKGKLESYFRSTRQEEYDTYSKIVKKLFEIVINPYLMNGPISPRYPLNHRI